MLEKGALPRRAPLLLHLGGPLPAQGLQPLVVLGQVHVAALAGIHNFLLGHPAGGLLYRRLLLGGRLLGPGLGMGRLRRPLLRRGGLLGLGGGLFPAGLFSRRGGLLRRRRGGLFLLLGGLFRLFLVGVGENVLNAGDLVVLRQIVEDDGQIPIRQHLHMVLRRGRIFCQNFRYGLGGQAKILCHLMDPVFFNTQSKHLVMLQPKGWEFFT